MRVYLLLLLPVLLISCQSTAQKNKAIDKKVDKVMKKFIAEKKISGAVTLYANSRDVFHLQAVGMANIEKSQPMTKDSLFRIASLTKNFTCTALMILQLSSKVFSMKPTEVQSSMNLAKTGKLTLEVTTTSSLINRWVKH